MSKVKLEHEGKAATGERITFDIEKENWNIYSLEDGTKLRARLVVGDVVRLDDHFTKDGDPIYVVKSTTILSADVPSHLNKDFARDSKPN